jgi:SagB-type dehydrogenase family enzyme
VIAGRYHDQTKHHFNRFARSLGYLDWTTQPDPFRRYRGAPFVELPRDPLAAETSYSSLFDNSVAPVRVDHGSIGEFLRCSMGLSAWKQYAQTRWALRVNPSSGNLHPTEAYLVHGGRVFHYAPREHGLEERCALDQETWHRFVGPAGEAFLVGLTSIHWREAWKYGERAFRYCQHDVGHALGALRLAAGMLGWRLALLPTWSQKDLGRLLGVDRDGDYLDGEREEPECLAVVSPHDPSTWARRDHTSIATAAAAGVWQGEANRLSIDHVEWPAISEVAEATRYPGEAPPNAVVPRPDRVSSLSQTPSRLKARDVVLSRRSAQAFDGRSTIARDRFLAMLDRLRPAMPPWDVLNWPSQVHLVLFVHRVEGLEPGVYAYLRHDGVLAEWQRAMRPQFLWACVAPSLYLLVPADVAPTAMRLACDQAIAADGFFSMAMVARMEASLRERGEWFYRRLFWECGLIGQVLYLEAEAGGGRGTGIGCFYDDPVHELLGLTGHAWQSLYHFSTGIPVDDTRLMTESGYPWEATPPAPPAAVSPR